MCHWELQSFEYLWNVRYEMRNKDKIANNWFLTIPTLLAFPSIWILTNISIYLRFSFIFTFCCWIYCTKYRSSHHNSSLETHQNPSNNNLMSIKENSTNFSLFAQLSISFETLTIYWLVYYLWIITIAICFMNLSRDLNCK